MQSQVITIERKRYAVGLFWQPVADGQNARAFAQKISKLVPGHVKLFTEYRSMVGVGSMIMGHKRGMPAAAAHVMEAFSDYNSFLAAFITKQGVWIVAARNGIIIHDKLYADEASAKKEFDTLFVLPDWGILVAPGYWSAARAEEKHLEEMVSGDSRYTIQPVSNFGSRMLSAAIVLAALGVGFYLFRAQVSQLFAPRSREVKVDAAVAEAYKKRLEAGDSMLVPRAKAQPEDKLEMPYDALPDLALRAEQCWQAISYLMQIIPGWSQVDAECEEFVVSTHLHRKYGSIVDIYNFIGSKMPGIEVVENSDSDLVLASNLEMLPTSSRLSESGGDEVARVINSVFQMMNAPVDVRQSVETVQGPNDQIASTNIVLVSATSSLEPGEFIKIFADYDAVALPLVRWNAGTRNWNYEVKIYVK